MFVWERFSLLAAASRRCLKRGVTRKLMEMFFSSVMRPFLYRTLRYKKVAFLLSAKVTVAACGSGGARRISRFVGRMKDG